jgi:hypothetical protein
VAGTLPPPETTQDRVSRWLAQDSAPAKDVSRETSPDPEEPESEDPEPEPDEAQGGDPNAQLEGDDEPESEGIRSLADLAKRLEVDEETLSKHLHVVGRDGKEIPLHDVLSAYRAPPPEATEVERTRTRLAELEGKEAEIGQAAEALRRTAQTLAAQLKAREPDWAKLRVENPAAYTTARLEWFEQERQLEQAARQYEMAQLRQQDEQRRQFEAYQRDEAQKLQSARPEWKDRKVFEAELEKTEQFLLSLGYQRDELKHVVSHRDWLVADKARRFDELQAKKPDVLKRVRALPRLLAPGASSGADRGASAARAQEEAARLEKFKQSGSTDDAAALIRSRLQGAARRAAGRALASGRRS